MERAVFRIIDANYNRAREALRAIEEFCRFGLNCELLSGKIKNLRHQLSQNISMLDSAKLIASRDTENDVGVGMVVENQFARTSLFDSVKANFARLTEALRVLFEMIAPASSSIANSIENIRYQAYILEKEVIMFADGYQKFQKVQLYVIITSTTAAEIKELTKKCINGGADCIQLRAKGIISDEKLFELANMFVEAAQKSSALTILNDRIDIAIASNADGVHLGDEDLPVPVAKSLMITPIIVGKTTHNMAELEKAIVQMPTYVGLGPAFETATKPNLSPAGLSYITSAVERLSDAGVGHVAIGGITLGNVDKILQAGAKAVAVSAAIQNSKEPEMTCREFKKKLAASNC